MGGVVSVYSTVDKAVKYPDFVSYSGQWTVATSAHVTFQTVASRRLWNVLPASLFLVHYFYRRLLKAH